MGTSEIDQWDPVITDQVKNWATRLLKPWFRPQVRGLDHLPATGAALVVSNHSGGTLTPDAFIFGPAFYNKFGYDRPLLTLAHFGLLIGPPSRLLRRLGAIEASRENAAAALRSGAVVLVFPGGDYDAYRPTPSRNKIDFNGRTGYVTTALDAGVPIVPVVSIGLQESQLFLTRGTWLAKRLRLDKLRLKILPVTFGLPFGFSVLLPPNIPLPTKVITEVLEPIDIATQFGQDPDVAEVDAHIRTVMQSALDRLARERRLPILG